MFGMDINSRMNVIWKLYPQDLEKGGFNIDASNSFFLFPREGMWNLIRYSGDKKHAVSAEFGPKRLKFSRTVQRLKGKYTWAKKH